MLTNASAGFLREHGFNLVLHAEERIGEAKIQGLIKHCLIKGVNGTGASTHCGTVAGNIERTKVIDSCLNHARHARFVADISHESLGSSAGTDNIASGLMGRLLVEIDDQNTRTLACKLHRDRAADTNTGARH